MTTYYVAFSGTDASAFRTTLNAQTLSSACREAKRKYGLRYSQQTMTVGVLHDAGTMYERGEPLCCRTNRLYSQWQAC